MYGRTLGLGLVMVICCAAPNCTNRQGKGKTVSFHRFPLKDAARLYLWTVAIQRSDWTPGPYSFLCSEHFTLDSFVPRMPDQHPLLRPDAVPSLFETGRGIQRKGAIVGIGIGGRKYVQKRRAPSSVEENTPPMYSNEEVMKENEPHFDINDRDDMNPSFLPKASPVTTVCRFIYSLHSYSRSSTTSLLQNVVNMEVPPYPDVEETEMSSEFLSSTPNSQCLSSAVQDSEYFLSLVDPNSQGLSCHVEVSDNAELNSITQDPPELEETEINTMLMESYEVCVEEPCDYTGEPHEFLLQEDYLDPSPVDLFHSYCSTSDPLPRKRHQCLTTCDMGWSVEQPSKDSFKLNKQDAPPLNPVVAPLAWMLGTWVSDPLGEGEFPSIPSFRYMEKAVISHVGQPMLNFMFCASNPETGKPLHRECGFIRVKPGTNQVAFVCAQNIGVVEVEEGEVQGEQLTLTSHSLSRMSFAKEPQVQQISRTFRLTPEGKLEQIVSMTTSTQAMAPHLRVTYKKVTS